MTKTHTLAEGQEVRNRRTGVLGVVTDFGEPGVVQVQVDDGFDCRYSWEDERDLEAV